MNTFRWVRWDQNNFRDISLKNVQMEMDDACNRFLVNIFIYRTLFIIYTQKLVCKIYMYIGVMLCIKYTVPH